MPPLKRMCPKNQKHQRWCWVAFSKGTPLPQLAPGSALCFTDGTRIYTLGCHFIHCPKLFFFFSTFRQNPLPRTLFPFSFQLVKKHSCHLQDQIKWTTSGSEANESPFSALSWADMGEELLSQTEQTWGDVSGQHLTTLQHNPKNHHTGHITLSCSFHLKQSPASSLTHGFRTTISTSTTNKCPMKWSKFHSTVPDSLKKCPVMLQVSRRQIRLSKFWKWQKQRLEDRQLWLSFRENWLRARCEQRGRLDSCGEVCHWRRREWRVGPELARLCTGYRTHSGTHR